MKWTEFSVTNDCVYYPHPAQMAQKLYDESEDHFLQMKKQGDQEAVEIFTDAIEKLCTHEASAASPEDLKRMINDIRERAKSSNSVYFKNAFPQLFQ